MAYPRLSYEDSCRRLHARTGEIPPMPDRLPQFDDSEPLGVRFFRTFVGDGDDLSNLTLPRSFFGRSEISNASFWNTDLTESNLCWNDFIGVDFGHAVLLRSDLRSSLFSRVNFISADLRDADMRLSSFEDCDFTDAQMSGTVLTRAQAALMSLSRDQLDKIAWAIEDGPEPAGG